MQPRTSRSTRDFDLPRPARDGLAPRRASAAPRAVRARGLLARRPTSPRLFAALAASGALFVGGVAGAGPIVDNPADHGLPFFVGRAATAKPLPKKDVVPHPFLGSQSSIHVDMYNSEATDLVTPLGHDPVVSSQNFGDLVGTCLNFFHGAGGELFGFCGALAGAASVGFDITRFDPKTLEKLATYRLYDFSFDELLSGPLELGYMVFDHEGRFVAIGRDNQVLWVGLSAAGQFEVKKTLDLSPYVPKGAGRLASVVPDYEGRLFYMTLGEAEGRDAVKVPALFGAIDPTTGAHQQREMTGEIVENGLAVGPDGVFLLTDRALYGFRFDTSAGAAAPQELFRQPYARSTVHKPGDISLGSGSTPTLLGDHLVAITDNADEQVHLLVYDRRAEPPGGRRVVCDVPVFDRGASSNENSVVGVGRSIVVQNWYGTPEGFMGGDQRAIVPGLTRIDVRPDDSGCDVVWDNREFAGPGTIKFSTATGLLYGVMIDRSTTAVDGYYLHAIDFDTGETTYRVRLGVGVAANINKFPTYVGPDGAILQPVQAGIIRVHDADAGRGGAGGSAGTSGSAGEGGPGINVVDLGGADGCRAAPTGRSAGPWAFALPAIGVAALLTRRRARRRQREATR